MNDDDLKTVARAIQKQGKDARWRAIAAVEAYKGILKRERIPVDDLLAGDVVAVRESDLLKLTEPLAEHFDGWEHACNCQECRTYE